MNFFNEKSKTVKSALLLFSIGTYEDITDVPDLFNLREVVQAELNKMK